MAGVSDDPLHDLPTPRLWLDAASELTVTSETFSAPVVTYCVEEVRRQGHDLVTVDGIERVGWLLDAWSYALHGAEQRRPLLVDALALGSLVERHKNATGWRDCSVAIRSSSGTVSHTPPSRSVPRLLETLWTQRDVLPPLEFYKQFELVHPFRDGNGRTGKVLLNWLNNTLLDPVFPPRDLFGVEIINP